MPYMYFRCTSCGEIWPNEAEFQPCPCGHPCGSRTSQIGQPPSLEEARKRAAYIRFDRFVKEETEGEREIRQVNSPYCEIHKDFQQVIEGAGFQEWERESIQKAESDLKEKEEA